MQWLVVAVYYLPFCNPLLIYNHIRHNLLKQSMRFLWRKTPGKLSFCWCHIDRVWLCRVDHRWRVIKLLTSLISVHEYRRKHVWMDAKTGWNGANAASIARIPTPDSDPVLAWLRGWDGWGIYYILLHIYRQLSFYRHWWHRLYPVPPMATNYWPRNKLLLVSRLFTGIDTPVFLALLPRYEKVFRGEFVADRKITHWSSKWWFHFRHEVPARYKTKICHTYWICIRYSRVL